MNCRSVLAVVCLCSMIPAVSFSALAPDLNDAIAYPNPCRAAKGERAVTFDNLTNAVRLRIFAVNGKQMIDKEMNTNNGVIVWDTADGNGEYVPHGTYFYIITDSSGHKKKGKIAIIR